MATSVSQTTAQSSMLNLPEGLSPDSIDTLPVLSAILSRLQPLTTTSAHSGTPAEASPSQLASSTAPLTTKDIPAATDELKRRLQKARAQVKELPDIERSLAEQEDEIRELEERIRKQRGVLEGLREVGLAARREKEDGEKEKGQLMEGVEH